MTEERLAEIEARVNAAWAEWRALCSGKKWRICIPVQPGDSDIVIDAVLRGVTDLLAEVERLQHENLVLMAREARETWKTIPVEEETDGELIARFWTAFAETHGDRPDLVATARRYAEEALADD